MQTGLSLNSRVIAWKVETPALLQAEDLWAPWSRSLVMLEALRQILCGVAALGTVFEHYKVPQDGMEALCEGKDWREGEGARPRSLDILVDLHDGGWELP